MGVRPEIVVYWRPGCGFCSALLRQLESHAVPHRRVNIWEDLRGASVVRSVANGNETVPTVTIGPIALVNPRLDDVLAVATEQVPEAVPAGWVPKPPSRFARWLHARLSGTSGA